MERPKSVDTTDSEEFDKRLKKQKKRKQKDRKKKKKQDVKSNFVLEQKRKEEALYKNLRLSTNKITTCNQGTLIGTNATLLAVKDETSFLIGSNRMGLRLDEGEKTVYTSKMLDMHNILSGIIYVRRLDAYFLCLEGKIYRKDIDGKREYIWMNIPNGCRPGRSFQYSDLNNRLIVAKNQQHIAVIDLDQAKVQIEMAKDHGQKITQFCLFGPKEDQVASLTLDGWISIYRFDVISSRGWIEDVQYVELEEKRGEMGNSISVCPKGRYVCVETSSKDLKISSKYFIFELKNKELILKASQDVLSQNLDAKTFVTCYGYLGAHLLFLGFTGSKANGKAIIIEYNEDYNGVFENCWKSVLHEESLPLEMKRLGDSYYYCGQKGSIMRLNLLF